jgi:hypothetical protein
MKITRLVEYSLFHKIEEVLSIQKRNDKPKSVDFLTYNLKYNNVQTKREVVVRINGVQSSQPYVVDYKNGYVIFSVPLTASDEVLVDYYYCPVHIYDEGANPESDDFKYPAVAIYEGNRTDKPYELGNVSKHIYSLWVIEVLSERGGECNDIRDTLMELFNENIPLIDYNQGFPKNADGAINPVFNEQAQTIGFMICEGINSEKGGSLNIGDKPKFLATIYVDLVVSK